MLNKLKAIFIREHVLVFFFCMAVVAGPALSVLFSNDSLQYPDIKTYIGLANFDFDQPVVRRYRVIMPFLARCIDAVGHPLFSKLAPTYYTGDISLPFSFFILNLLALSFAGVLVYRYCRAYGADRLSSIAGLLVLLTCRYTAYYIGLPMVDSFFFAIIALTLLGLKLKNTSMLVWAIFLGPFAKESYVLMVPLLIWYSPIPRLRMLFYILLSGVLIFSYRYAYDYLTGYSSLDVLSSNARHMDNIKKYAPMLLSFTGLYKIFSNTGFWTFVPLLGLAFVPHYRSLLYQRLSRYMAVYIAIVVFQMLLSGSFERMFYLALPLVCVIIALTVGWIRARILIPEK